MKKFLKSTLALILVLVMVSSTIVGSAAVLNETAVNLHKGQYENYLLLGDSAASGYRDELTKNDSDFDKAHNQTVYWRVPGSYADIIANSIIEDKSMTAFAAPGFRTIEVRYMLEDDYAENCTDEYLFHPSQLRVYEKYGYLPGDERIRKAYQKAVADADLISLGIGGNDWGAYLGWVVTDVLEKENVADKYIKMANDIIANSELDLSTVEKLLEVAHYAGALPELLTAIPEALNYGVGNFYYNWNIMIDDIYKLNPDVTLMVVGLSDTGLKGRYYDYPDAPGGEIPTEEQNPAVASLMKTITDFILDAGNKPMIEGAKKFGYKYVDIAGATYVDSHPDALGHEFIANAIIEALPDPDISTKFEDVNPGHEAYVSIEYVLSKGIMSATSETTFSPDAALTKGQLAEAFNAINGDNKATDSEAKATLMELATQFVRSGAKKGVVGFVKGFSFAANMLLENKLNFGASVTRAQAAKYFKSFCD